MAGQIHTVEQIIARIASEAHGVVTRAELVAADVSEAEIDHRLRIGALIRQHPGVYRAGHAAPCTEADYLAAVKALGEGAVLGGLAAAWLLGLIGGRAPQPEVITPTQRRVRGVLDRRTRGTHRRDWTTIRGIPVTTPARTLVDVAARMPEDQLGLACHQAGFRFETTPRHVNEVLTRRPTSPGAAKLRRIMSGETKIALSALERKFLQRLREAGLPLPDHTNRRAGTKRVDCRWTRQKLTVELDSYKFHNSRYSWEQDRRREREAHARGDQFRRYTWGDVVEHPAQMLAELRDLLELPSV